MNNLSKMALFGLLTGLVLVGWTYLQYLLGYHTQTSGRYTGLLVLPLTVAGLTWGIRSYRSRQPGQVLGYWEAVLAGLVITFFAGLVQAGFTYLYYEQIFPGIVDFLARKKREQLAAQHLAPADIAGQVAQLRHYHQAGPMALRTFGGFLGTGTAFTLILAALLKRYPRD